MRIYFCEHRLGILLRWLTATSFVSSKHGDIAVEFESTPQRTVRCSSFMSSGQKAPLVIGIPEFLPVMPTHQGRSCCHCAFNCLGRCVFEMTHCVSRVWTLNWVHSLTHLKNVWQFFTSSCARRVSNNYDGRSAVDDAWGVSEVEKTKNGEIRSLQ